MPELLTQLASSKFVSGYFYSFDFWMNYPKYQVSEFWAISTSSINSIKPFNDREEFLKYLPDNLKDPDWNPYLSYTC